MKRGVFATATAMALIMAQVAVPPVPGMDSRAFAQSDQQEQPPAAEAAPPQPEEAPAAEEQPAPPPAPPAPEQQAEQAPAPEPQPAPEQQAAPAQEAAPPAPEQQAEQPPAEQPPAPEQQQQAAPAQETAPPAPEQQAEQAPVPEPQPEQQAAPAQEAAPPAPEQQAEQAPAPEAPQQNAAGDDRQDRDGTKRKRKQRGEQARQPAQQDEAQPPAQSAGQDDSPQPQPMAEKPVEAIIEQAKEQPPAVVPDELTKQQQEQLRQAEQKRREDARKRRRELLGAAAAGAAIGALVPALGGRIVADQGDRFVVERDGDIYVRSDESARFRGNGARVDVEQMRGGRTRETVTRRNGVRIITVRDSGGYVLRRLKETPDGRRFVLFDQRDEDRRPNVDYGRRLPPLRVDLPRDQYIVSGRRANRRAIRDTFMAPPVERVESGYTLREVRENERLRGIVRRVDVDTITFAFGSAAVRESEVYELSAIAGGMLDVIDRDPSAVFLVEGHTDAVGSDVDNLVLSDRRAESVARVLTEGFGVPPENMVTEGYGEAYLKIDTQQAEQQNRRVTIRNISPLLTSQN